MNEPAPRAAPPALPEPLVPDTAPRHPPMLPHELPPGVQLVILPGGARTLAYVPTPAAPPPARSAAPIPAWARTTALLAPTVGAGIGGAAVGLSAAAPGLLALSDALWSLVALIAAGTIGGAALLGRGRRAAPTQITQHITARGFIARATGTVKDGHP
ncbi:hypothetical protein [Streptomyces sp. NPDC003077]|uniref:hypothetical protein n=1 Tax=Streptomyces sp. NPDC003077 TaxID=3154443 RepID=UPI0033BF4DE5